MSQQRRHLAAHSSCSIHEKTLLCSSSIIKTGTNFWIFIFSKQHHFFLSYYLFHKWWAVPWAHKTESCYTTRNECNVGSVIHTDTSVGHLLSLYHLTAVKLPDTSEEKSVFWGLVMSLWLSEQETWWSGHVARMEGACWEKIWTKGFTSRIKMCLGGCSSMRINVLEWCGPDHK